MKICRKLLLAHRFWWVCCLFIKTALEKCSIRSFAHQCILCSEWVPSMWELNQHLDGFKVSTFSENVYYWVSNSCQITCNLKGIVPLKLNLCHKLLNLMWFFSLNHPFIITISFSLHFCKIEHQWSFHPPYEKPVSQSEWALGYWSPLWEWKLLNEVRHFKQGHLKPFKTPPHARVRRLQCMLWLLLELGSSFTLWSENESMLSTRYEEWIFIHTTKHKPIRHGFNIR